MSTYYTFEEFMRMKGQGRFAREIKFEDMATRPQLHLIREELNNISKELNRMLNRINDLDNKLMEFEVKEHD